MPRMEVTVEEGDGVHESVKGILPCVNDEAVRDSAVDNMKRGATHNAHAYWTSGMPHQ
jgi:hypothetical protein